MKNKILYVLITVTSLSWKSLAMYDLIDIPTTQINEKYSTELNFRLYSNGGTVSRLTFGVFPQLTVGFSLDIVSLIGTEHLTVRQPSLNLKLRLFDGTQKLPAVAIGYDGQGYRYDEVQKKYLQKERGVYLVGEMEAIGEGIIFNFGTNVNFTQENSRTRADFYCFLGILYNIMKNEEKILSFLLEFDNVLKDIREDRYNFGIKIFPAENFSIDFDFKDIGSARNLPVERLIKIMYNTQF